MSVRERECVFGMVVVGLGKLMCIASPLIAIFGPPTTHTQSLGPPNYCCDMAVLLKNVAMWTWKGNGLVQT